MEKKKCDCTSVLNKNARNSLCLSACAAAIFLFYSFPILMQSLYNFFLCTYLPFDGSGNPSNVHVTCGVGFPAAEHFNETAGPGCSVCSMKLYSMTGGASENTKRKLFREKRLSCMRFKNGICGAYEYSHPAKYKLLPVDRKCRNGTLS